MMIKQLLYGVLGAGAFGTVSICDLCTPAAQTALAVPAARSAIAAPAAVTGTKTARLKVAGMTCGGCVIGTRKVLTRLPGVTKADVSYARGEAIVTYDPAKVTVAQMIAAVKTLGYTATVVGS